MVVLEQRVQILQEEKSVLTSMERRLQERCAELQRDVFRLQGIYNNENYTLEKRPVALPRQVPPQASKNGSSEQEDEGISSSDTGQSLSSGSESMLVVNLTQKKQTKYSGGSVNTSTDYTINDDETVRIEDVIEELENVVNVASRELNGYSTPSIEKTSGSHDSRSNSRKEKEIVPVNLLPQPPKRSRSLVHLLSSGSEFDGSEYGMLLIPNGSGQSFCNEMTAADMKMEKYGREFSAEPMETHKSTTNRELLDEIMDAQEMENPLPPFITGERLKKNEQINPLLPYIEGSPQKFDGVFFMSELGTSRKYSKSDLMVAFDAKRAAKSAERIESFEGSGIESIIDIVVTNDSKQQKLRSPFETKVLSSFVPHSAKNIMDGSTFFIGSQALSADTGNGLKSMGSKLTDLPSGLY